MQIVQLLLSAFVAGTTMVVASSSSSGDLANTNLDGMARMRRHHHAASAAGKKMKRTTCKAKKVRKGQNAIAKGSKKNSNNNGANGSGNYTGTTGGNGAFKGMAGKPAPPSGQRTKWGLSYTGGVKFSEFDQNAGFFYTWHPSPGNVDLSSTKAQFFPMLWGASDDKVNEFNKMVTEPVERGENPVPSKTILLFNEPDTKGQSDIPVEKACNVARPIVQRLKKHGFNIIGPAPSGQDATWYPRFVKQCPDVEKMIDYHAIHYYETDANSIIDKIQKWYKSDIGGKPIYLTEVGCHSYTGGRQPTSVGEVQQFLNTLAAFAAKSSYIYGLSAFGLMTGTLPGDVGSVNRLATSSGSPTPLFRAAAAHF